MAARGNLHSKLIYYIGGHLTTCDRLYPVSQGAYRDNKAWWGHDYGKEDNHLL